MKNLEFSIELQTNELTCHQVAQVIQRVIGGAIQFFTSANGLATRVIDLRCRRWDVVPRSNWHARQDYQTTIISPSLTFEDIPLLQTIAQALGRAGAVTDDRCGFHVAVARHHFDARAVINLTRLLHAHEQLIRYALQVTRARRLADCRYTNPAFIRRLAVMQPRTMDELNVAWFGEYTPKPDDFDPMQCGLNLHALWARGQVEFRYFNATLDPEKLKANIFFALALAATAIHTHSVESAPPSFCARTARADFRTLLRRIGLRGEELAFAEKHLFTAIPAVGQQAPVQAGAA